MMKKIVSISAVAATLMLSGQALAATGVLESTGTVTAVECDALSNDVTVQLSKNVNAAWGCTAIQYSAATCHINGTNKSQTLTCSYTKNTATDGTVTYTANGSTCPTWDGQGTAPVKTFTYVGRVGFTGGSGGGSVGSAELTAATCDKTTVTKLIPTTAGY